jgi:hypothetical protein
MPGKGHSNKSENKLKLNKIKRKCVDSVSSEVQRNPCEVKPHSGYQGQLIQFHLKLMEIHVRSNNILYFRAG